MRSHGKTVKWRHTNVLFLMASAVQTHLKAVDAKLKGTAQRQFSHFVRAGEKPLHKQRHRRYGLLSGAHDRRADFDLPEFHSRARPTSFHMMFAVLLLRWIDASPRELRSRVLEE